VPDPPAIAVWWWRTVDLDDAAVDALLSGLPDDERQRAARFVHGRDRRDYVAAHALLRHALSRHLASSPPSTTPPGPASPGGTLANAASRNPRAWRLARDAHGKPFVANPAPGGTPLTCNLSHAPGFVACVIADGHAVGIDVEPVMPRVSADITAREQFAPPEVQALARLDGEAYVARFVELWTLREAYLKGVGVGLWGPTVPALWFSFDEPGSLECHQDAGSAPWEFALLSPLGYRMAVAMDVPKTAGRRWSLTLNGIVAEGAGSAMPGSGTAAVGVLGTTVRSTGVLTVGASREHDADGVGFARRAPGELGG
jgi:4'-phosphopantetheinyl transferase